MTRKYNAIWQYQIPKISTFGSERFLPSVNTFIYEDDTLIIHMLSMSTVEGLPEDDVFRIKTKWVEQDLYIFPPLGNSWELFATWEEDHFVIRQNEQVIEFQKIEPDEVVAWQRDLLKPERKMWDYPFMNPDDVEINSKNDE